MSTSRRRAAIATFVGNTINVLIVSIQAVVLIPLYLSTIGSRLYGAWLGSGDILVWMHTLDLGLPNLMIQRIGAATGQGDVRTIAEYFATGMAVLALIAAIVTGIGVILAQPLPTWMGLEGAEAWTLKSCFMVGTAATALNLLNNGVVGFSRGIQRTTFMNIVVIFSSLTGFGVSLAFLLTGRGLWAIVLGLVSRACTSLAGSVFFAVRALPKSAYQFFRVRRSILREFFAISPAAAVGGISYALMNHSETALAAILISPELAAVLALTRKALQLAQSLVDMVAFAAYGGFAHLVTSDQRHRTLRVHTEIRSMRLSLAVVTAAAYMAVNQSLVSVWVGREQYGGALLTILLATHFVVSGSSFLINYLYRATGQIVRGSIALTGESLIRIPLMIGLLVWLGLPGVPVAGIMTAAAFGWVAYRWTVKEVASFADPPTPASRSAWLTRVSLFGLGAVACVFVSLETWTYVFAAGLAIAIGGGVALLYADRNLSSIRALFAAALNRIGIDLPLLEQKA